MTDRYLCKAKRTDNGERVEGYYYEANISGAYILQCKTKARKKDGVVIGDEVVPYEVDPTTLCQYTGKTDKNGKKIWENDIIRDDDDRIGVVKFGQYDSYHIGFFVEWVSEKAKYYRSELGYWSSKVEVVGNFFDNPELLGGDAE